MVSLGSMRDDVYVHDERANEYRGRRVGQRVGLGARVQIKVGSVDVTRRRVDFAFLALLAAAPGLPPTPPRAEPRKGRGSEPRKGRPPETRTDGRPDRKKRRGG